jgi:hypothetical protein
MKVDPANHDNAQPRDDADPRTHPVAADPDASRLEPSAAGIGRAGEDGMLEPLKDAAIPDAEDNGG